MRQKSLRRTSPKAQRKPAVRAPISFPSELYETLEKMAQQKKLSVAWVVRDAAEKYAAENSTHKNEFSRG